MTFYADSTNKDIRLNILYNLSRPSKWKKKRYSDYTSGNNTLAKSWLPMSSFFPTFPVKRKPHKYLSASNFVFHNTK